MSRPQPLDRRRLSPRLRAALFLCSIALLPVAAAAQGRGPASELEEARRLTWSQPTRKEGIARLRRLVQADPTAVEPRLELGRVLSWDRRTRPEATDMLRRLAKEHPTRADVQEALAEVLSWSAASRPEAVDRLRRVLEREPGRAPARLRLAEILSWDKASRREAEAIYRSVLRDHPDSDKARVGLARLLSWQGDRSAARALYQEVLARDPGNVEARVGLAEVEQWSGRLRASLQALQAYPAGSLDTPEAFQRRAEAYSGIGRPARALQEYEALLAARPDDESVRQAVDAARLRLRPVLEVGVDVSTEDGDPLTSRVDIVSLPITFTWHPKGGDTAVHLLASGAGYDNDRGTTTDLSAGVGIDAPIGNRVRLSGEIRGHDFEEAGTELTGLAEARIAAGDRIEVLAGVSRDQVFSSRLSLGGEVIGGVLYGPVLENAAFAGLSARPGRSWDLWARLLVGRLEGENVIDNDRLAAFAGFGRTLRLGEATLRAGYALTWFEFDRDLGGFPPAALGGDGIGTQGAGGYFSPFRFLNQMVRLDAGVPLGKSVGLVAGSGLGRQEVEDVNTGGDSVRDTSSDAYLGCRWQVRERLSIRGQISYQNVAAAFDRTVGRVSFSYVF